MSDLRTVWYSLETRRATAASRERVGILVAVCLLCAVAAAEVIFLHVAGADPVAAADGMAMPQ